MIVVPVHYGKYVQSSRLFNFEQSVSNFDSIASNLDSIISEVSSAGCCDLSISPNFDNSLFTSLSWKSSLNIAINTAPMKLSSAKYDPIMTAPKIQSSSRKAIDMIANRINATGVDNQIDTLYGLIDTSPLMPNCHWRLECTKQRIVPLVRIRTVLRQHLADGLVDAPEISLHVRVG